MSRMLSCLLLVAAAVSTASATDHHGRDLAVVMTNDPSSNALEVYDVRTGVLVQRLSTRGKGGAAGNARGVRQLEGEVIAAVNFGSSSVTLFRREGDRLRFDGQVQTTSQPVSVDFGNGHMYVAGVTTVDSFVMHDGEVGRLDGTAQLELAGGGAPAEGSTAQVGVLDERHLLVTLKAPAPGTVDVIPLRGGAVSDAPPLAVPAPEGSLTPFGFLANGDGSALVTLTGTNENALFRGEAFVDVVPAGQGSPCWMTRAGQDRVRGQHERADHRPHRRDRQPCVRRCAGGGIRADRRTRGRRRRRRRAGRGGPRRRSRPPVAVRLQRLRRAGPAKDNHARRRQCERGRGARALIRTSRARRRRRGAALGFSVAGRSPVDEYGRPFPLLHMRREA